MNSSETVKDAASRMAKAVDAFNHSLTSVHTTASPAMVEGLRVEAYGSTSRLMELAAITTPDNQTIAIQPWDKSVMQDIVKAIQVANIGLNPVADGLKIRCAIPELSRERRQELVKSIHAMGEDGKVRIRGIRRDVLDELKKAQKESLISEDDLKRLEKAVQADTDKFVKQIGDCLAVKEKELMTL